MKMDVQAPAAASHPLLRLEGICARYDEKMVLHDVSLQVTEHDYLGVIGPNGGGKTTLMRVILGLVKPVAGTVTYYRHGQPADNVTMGYLPQYNEIDRQFPISVYEVVLSGLDNRRQLFHRYSAEQHRQVVETLELMQIDTLSRRSVGTLSGGQLQRVLLARAMVSRPEVLILDEPNTYIDKRFEHQMYDMLDRLNQRCAIILVSHDIAAVLDHARHIACVNHTLHYHDTADMPRRQLEQHFLHV